MEEEKPKVSEQAGILLEQRRIELVKIIESFENLEKSKEWATLKELVFSKSAASIERQILIESLASKIDTNKLYKLQGEYVWARHYNDVGRFVETLKKELDNVNKKIK
jgi:hypothetical protein